MSPPIEPSVSLTLSELVKDFAAGLEAADHLAPVAENVKTKVAFKPGIGPHSESHTIKLVMDQMVALHASRYTESALGVSYGDGSRRVCDICIGSPSSWEWAIEVKMFRPMGDNGKSNDNILMHILSPYPSHRSALTDCAKLATSDLGGTRAVLIYGYDCDEMPLGPAIQAFEVLAHDRDLLGDQHRADFGGLIHPVHQSGSVYAWEIISEIES